MCKHTYMHTHTNTHIHMHTHGGGIPQELKLQAVISHPTWVLGMNLNLIQNQYGLLTTEPSLQPPKNFKFMILS